MANPVIDTDAELTESSTTPEKKERDLSQPQPGWQTFHWELNLYTAVALYALYQLTWLRPLLHVIFALVAVDASIYYYRKGSMAGVPYTFPLVSLVAMIVNPERFWAELANICLKNDGFCTNNLVGNFMVFVTDPRAGKEIFVGDNFGLYAHPNAYWLFGPKNLIYLEGDTHKKVRSILTPALFSDDALLQYAKMQEQVVRRYLQKYEKTSSDETPLNLMFAFRTMAAASSQEAFLGPYLTDEMRLSLEEDILIFTMGFLSFPFPYAFGLRKAIQAKNRIEDMVKEFVPRSREYVKAGNAPRCLLERWSAQIMEEAANLGCAPNDVPYCSDDDVALCVLDFLFAAQDATNSGLTYALDVLDADRAVLAKLRSTVDKACGRNGAVAAKLRQGDELEYVNKVANQLLHYKPPVPMVPHLVRNSCELNGYSIPKGTVVIPSIIYSGRVSGASLEFLPDRSDPDSQFVKVPTFGGGQHKCPGRRYAESLMQVFLGVLAQDYDFHRTGTRPSADDFIFYPTVFPKDSNFVIKKRA